MSEIELRLSNVDPPAPEPKRTIYRDIVNLPDPVKLGLTIRYFNHDDVDLYFQITGSATGYTFGTVNLGLLASGANTYINLDEFASRAKPSASDLPNGEKEENIALTLKAYTDSGYSNLKWTFERVVTVHWINSADAAFTVDFLNNFDDGDVQGWARVNEAASWFDPSVASDYVLSTPYSLKTLVYAGDIGDYRVRLYKSFSTPNKAKVFAIIDVRLAADSPDYAKYLQVNRDAVTLVFLGKPADTTSAHYIPVNKWLRIVVPLPSNQTVEIRIIYHIRRTALTGGNPSAIWLDDFKILSK
jgi:hypothetical protein